MNLLCKSDLFEGVQRNPQFWMVAVPGGTVVATSYLCIRLIFIGSIFVYHYCLFYDSLHQVR